jgi:hypothetical protein
MQCRIPKIGVLYQNDGFGRPSEGFLAERFELAPLRHPSADAITRRAGRIPRAISNHPPGNPRVAGYATHTLLGGSALLPFVPTW